MNWISVDISKSVNLRLISLFFLLLNIALLYYVSFSREHIFYEHIENFSSDKISLVLLAFIFTLSAYGIMFFEKKDKLDRKEIAVVCFIFVFALMTPPFLSRDLGIYLIGARNFIWFEFNPYFSSLNNVVENIWAGELGAVSWLNYPYPYGPVFLMIASAAVLPNFAHLVGAVYFYKAIVFLAYGLSVIIFAKIVKSMSLDKVSIILYALNPALLINGVMEGHNEIFIILLLLSSIYFIVKEKSRKSYFFWLAAVFVKYNALIFLPIFWKKDGKFSFKNVFFSGVGVAIALALTIGIFFRQDVGAFISNANIMKGQLQSCFYRCSPAVSISDLLTGEFSGAFRMILFSLLYALIFFRFLIQRDNFLKFLFWSFLALLFVLTRWISPWYVLTIIPIGLLIGEKKYRAIVFLLTTYSLLHFFGLF